MNYIDILLGLVVLFCIWMGWQRGFIISATNLLVLAVGLTLTFLFYPYLNRFLANNFRLGVYTLPMAFLLTFVVLSTILSIIASKIIHSFPAQAHMHTANRAMGMIPGLVRGALYAIVFSALLLSIPIADGLSRETRDSEIASRTAPSAEWLQDKFSPVFNDAAKQTMHRLTVDPKSEKTVQLHFTVKDPKVRHDLEARMLELVNEERVKHGLKPVKADPEMAVVARLHSKDMFARGYFSHHTPEGKDPFDRMKLQGVKFLTAGENLALAQTLRLAHTGLMNSPGHRANILQPAFGRLGIGILDGGMYGIMVTQNFRN